MRLLAVFVIPICWPPQANRVPRPLAADARHSILASSGSRML